MPTFIVRNSQSVQASHRGDSTFRFMSIVGHTTSNTFYDTSESGITYYYLIGNRASLTIIIYISLPYIIYIAAKTSDFRTPGDNSFTLEPQGLHGKKNYRRLCDLREVETVRCFLVVGRLTLLFLLYLVLDLATLAGEGTMESLPTTSSSTTTTPCPSISSARAAAYDRSMIRPRPKGPRSLTFTITSRSFLVFLTFSNVPKGWVRWAQVKLSW